MSDEQRWHDNPATDDKKDGASAAIVDRRCAATLNSARKELEAGAQTVVQLQNALNQLVRLTSCVKPPVPMAQRNQQSPPMPKLFRQFGINKTDATDNPALPLGPTS